MILKAERDIDVVGEAANGREAVQLACDLEPDVVLMDVRMPDLDGIEATARILAEGTAGRVLMLTTFDRDQYVYEAMRAGASGFLLKTVAPDRLVAAVRLAVSGEALLAPEITRRLIEDFVRRPLPDAADEQLAPLTDREREVLCEVARGHTNADITRALYLSESTVKTYVARILMKLGLRDRTQAVVLAYETGLVRPGQ